MIVGHAALGFLLVASLAVLVDHDRPVALGLVAAAAAMAPDVDIVAGLLGLAGATLTLGGVSDSFAAGADLAHRGITHTLVAALLAGAVAYAASGRGDRRRRLASALACIFVLLWLQPTAVVALVLVTFVAVCLGITHVATRHAPLTAGELGATVFLGVLTHPFGDVVAGDPPMVFYPLSAAPLLDAFTPLTATNLDHTVLLLSLELALVWASILLAAVLTDRSVRPVVGLAGGTGAVVAATAVQISSLAYYELAGFVGGVIGVVALASLLLHGRLSPPVPVTTSGVRAGVDAIAAVTLLVWVMALATAVTAWV